MRLAWFSPLPPNRSGIAAYSAEILPFLRARHDIDIFVDRSVARENSRRASGPAWAATADRPAGEAAVYDAHDFVWKHRRDPYALTVFQLGNASCHDYMWAYLFNYPGLVILHDAQLHQARALWLTRWRARRDDYLAEFAANHPEAPPDVGYLVVAGMGESLYQHWPLTRLVIETARLTIVHNTRLRAHLEERYPGARLDAIEMGVADPIAGVGGASIRERHGLPPDAIVVAAFGGVTREKRIAPLIRAVSALAERHPALHLVLVGEQAEHYDVQADIERWRIADRVHVTGYVKDEELPAYLHAADICACLRWPTNRELSGSWLRCLAAGRATVITEMTHLIDVPSLDPHDMRLRAGAAAEPVTVSIDIVDEDHSLHLALHRLAADAPLRARLGKAARAWWSAHHRLDSMADHYERVLARAAMLPPPDRPLPAHLRTDHQAAILALAGNIDVAGRVQDLFG